MLGLTVDALPLSDAASSPRLSVGFAVGAGPPKPKCPPTALSIAAAMASPPIARPPTPPPPPECGRLVVAEGGADTSALAS